MTLVLRSCGILFAATLLIAALAGVLLPKPKLQLDSVAVMTPPIISPLPPADRQAGPSLIERSPFAQSRAAFSRNAGPPPPEIEVKLAGIFKVGKETRASLVIGGQAVTVRKGDETPVGTVTSIEPSAVVIDGSTPRRVELFKQ